MDSRYDIFFSYSHSDSGVARELAKKFESAGLSCFLAEKDIGAGEQWESRIRDAIHAADRMVLLITPRSKNNLWVMIEAGAAWVLRKDLITALMFVDAGELMDPIRRYQARLVETSDQTAALVSELVGQRPRLSNEAYLGLSGQWIDDEDRDTVFFRQAGERVVGFYDYGAGDRKVGVYLGRINKDDLAYRWKWLNGQFEGHGRMRLAPDGQRLSGEWWHGKDIGKTEPVTYRRISEKMPPWVNNEDFEEYKAFLGGAEHAP